MQSLTALQITSTLSSAKRFRDWLANRDPGAFAMRRCPGACPIAVYVALSTGHEVSVGVNTLSVLPGDMLPAIKVPLPTWVQEFVASVDRPVGCTQVTRDDALALLDGVIASQSMQAA